MRITDAALIVSSAVFSSWCLAAPAERAGLAPPAVAQYRRLPVGPAQEVVIEPKLVDRVVQVDPKAEEPSKPVKSDPPLPKCLCACGCEETSVCGCDKCPCVDSNCQCGADGTCSCGGGKVLSYARGYELSVSSGKPLCVHISQYREDLAKKLPECLHCFARTLDDAQPGAVVVAKPNGSKLSRIADLNIPTATVIYQALNPPQIAPQIVPQRYYASPSCAGGK